MIQRNGNAPYAPAATVLELIDRFRDHGLSVPFDTEVLMRAGVTESLTPRTLQALKLLDLIDDAGYPTPNLQGLQEAPSDEYEARLAEVVKTAYKDVFAFTNPATDSPDRIEDAFRGYKPLGQRGRMVTLFTGLCQRAGIIEGAAKRPPGPKPRSLGPTIPQFKPVTSRQRPPRPQRTSGHEFLDKGLPTAIVALINDLPVRGQGWTTRDRDTFMNGFRATVEIYYPARSEPDDHRPKGELLPGPPKD